MPRKPVLLLEQARELVEEYIEGLDLTQSTCPCCSVVRYENWQDARSHEALSGVVTKLTRQIGFANGDDQ